MSFKNYLNEQSKFRFIKVDDVVDAIKSLKK
jgi:hypothetical protein